MKNINVTFSIPPEMHKSLQKIVGRRNMSKFVAKALEVALEAKKMELKKEYIEASNDKGHKEAMEDWAALENEGWE
jgi:hypothetical protein